ncbi:MAG: SMP-30/gluconolactonase/LRE family protein [Treponema sp.]|nr:SMP-30/gluconolactonase/LRE family protein [Treponema sp.]
MKTYTAQVFSKEKFSLGESPFYDSRTKTMSWVDIPKGTLYTQTMDGEKNSFCLGQAIGSAVPGQKEGSYILAATDGLYLLENGKASLVKKLTDFYESYQRSNDAKADPAGRLWFGSSVDDGIHEASGNLFCLDGGKVFCREANTKISNGMGWSRDCKKFYFSDTLQKAVFSYDYDLSTGLISNKKVLFTPDEARGLTDGMCIDADDNLWVAFWGGSRIECRSTKDGSILATVNIDAKHVTSCCFIGERLDTLLITTSGNDLTGEHDGCLFTCKVDERGRECDFAKTDNF